MPATAKQYGQAVFGQYSGTATRVVDWVNDTIKVSLHTVSYVPDQDAHDFFDDLTNEISGTGYTAGGAALGGKTLTYDAATNRVRCKASNTAWTTSTFGPFRIAVVYKDTGVVGTSPLLTYIDFGADISVASGTFTIIWNGTDGVFYYEVL